MYALLAALLAAAFLIPYKAAGTLGSRSAIVAAMLLCAAVLNTMTGVAKRGGKPIASRVSLLTIAGLGVLTVTGNIGMAAALSYQEPAVTAVLLQVQIFLVAGIEWAVLRERITGRFAVGAAIALGGFALMQLGSGGMSAHAIGVAWAMVAALSFACMHVLTRAVIHRIDAVWVNAFRLWLASAVLLSWPGTASAAAALSLEAWLLCAAAALLGPMLSRLCLMWSVRYIPASRATLVAMAGPLFALALGLAAFGVIPTARELGGGALILVGVAIPLVAMTSRAAARSGTGP